MRGWNHARTTQILPPPTHVCAAHLPRVDPDQSLHDLNNPFVPPGAAMVRLVRCAPPEQELEVSRPFQ